MNEDWIDKIFLNFDAGPVYYLFEWSSDLQLFETVSVEVRSLRGQRCEGSGEGDTSEWDLRIANSQGRHPRGVLVASASACRVNWSFLAKQEFNLEEDTLRVVDSQTYPDSDSIRWRSSSFLRKSYDFLSNIGTFSVCSSQKMFSDMRNFNTIRCNSDRHSVGSFSLLVRFCKFANCFDGSVSFFVHTSSIPFRYREEMQLYKWEWPGSNKKVTEHILSLILEF